MRSTWPYGVRTYDIVIMAGGIAVGSLLGLLRFYALERRNQQPQAVTEPVTLAVVR